MRAPALPERRSGARNIDFCWPDFYPLNPAAALTISSQRPPQLHTQAPTHVSSGSAYAPTLRQHWAALKTKSARHQGCVLDTVRRRAVVVNHSPSRRHIKRWRSIDAPAGALRAVAGAARNGQSPAKTTNMSTSSSPSGLAVPGIGVGLFSDPSAANPVRLRIKNFPLARPRRPSQEDPTVAVETMKIVDTLRLKEIRLDVGH